MNHFVRSALIAVALFGGILVFIELGRRIGARRPVDEGAPAGIGVLEGSIFALLGLVIAFSFSGALTRFDWRRQLVVEEVNDIGTAYLRIDLLPAPDQPAMRKLFREYVETRLNVYRRLDDIEAFNAELARLAALQNRIWADAIASARQTNTPMASMLLLPALNAMFDILNTQVMAGKTHPPLVVFGMLMALALVSALLVGHDMARARDRHWIHLFGFSIAVAFSVYVILDLEYPRLGLIRIDEFDRAMVDLLNQMKQGG